MHQAEKLYALQDLLPIGSIIKLDSSPKKMMIIGHLQINPKDDCCYDYTAVLWPEGLIDSTALYLFQHSRVAKVYAAGVVNEEQQEHMAVMEQLVKASYPKEQAGEENIC